MFGPILLNFSCIELSTFFLPCFDWLLGGLREGGREVEFKSNHVEFYFDSNNLFNCSSRTEQGI